MTNEIFSEILSETEVAVRDTLRRFAVDVMRPIGKQLDTMTPEEVIAKDSPLWEANRKYAELGFFDFAQDDSLSPVEVARLGALSAEMMGWGDAGLAIGFTVTNMPITLAQMTENEALIEKFSAYKTGCWAITEPNHGSDLVDFGGSGRDESNRRGDCVARRDGDNIVIKGQKSSWVSNGTIAEMAALYCAYEDDDGVQGGGGPAVLPHDARSH